MATATLRMKLAGRFRSLDDRRNKMLRVPELPHPAIIQTVQHTGTGRAPIGREHRLPHCEHYHLAFGVVLEDGLDRGGPPQTGRSSWRKQENDAQFGRRPIEFRLQGGKRCAVHFHERWLTGRRMARSREVNAAENSQYGRCENDGPSQLHGESLRQSRHQFGEFLGKDHNREDNHHRQPEQHQT